MRSDMANLREPPARKFKGCTCETPPLADFRPRLAEFWKRSSFCSNLLGLSGLGVIEAGAPILRWRQPGMRLEGPIEGPDRAESGVERDRQERHIGLGWVGHAR